MIDRQTEEEREERETDILIDRLRKKDGERKRQKERETDS